MNRPILMLLIPACLVGLGGCESKPKRGSGSVVVTSQGVYLEQVVVDDDKIKVDDRELMPLNQPGNSVDPGQ